MSYGKQQQEEIKTIKERNITVRLSDADCESLLNLCGENGLTVGELVAGFIGDLVHGTYSHGSDERMYAERWFSRCCFSMLADNTLLRNMIAFGFEPEEYLEILDDIESLETELAELDAEADREEALEIKEAIQEQKEALKDMEMYWEPEVAPDTEKEIEILRQWVKEKEAFLSGSGNTK